MKAASMLLMITVVILSVSCDRAGDAAAKRAIEKAAEKDGRSAEVEIDRERKSITVTLEEKEESDSR